uniref:ABC transporter domain-containing protein n=1 Tax=Rhabditophanes sp. KR3021 TaxID=114890 RepID=A0AC35U127_9BILA
MIRIHFIIDWSSGRNIVFGRGLIGDYLFHFVQMVNSCHHCNFSSTASIIATLSGGQKSRVAFASLALEKPNYLILDEITNHLDTASVDALAVAINEFKGGVVLVSHDERLIELVCKELWVLQDKRIFTLEGGIEEYKKHVYSQLSL